MDVNKDFELSIIVAIYNIEDELPELLVELEKLKKTPKIEVLLMNDGSTDQTESILDKVEVTDNFKVFSLENGGLSSIRNRGMLISSGKYIWFVDGDDIIDANFVTSVLSFIEDEQPDFLQFQYQRFERVSDIKFKKSNEEIEKYKVLTKDDWMERLNDSRNAQFENYAWAHIVKKSLYLNNAITFPEKRNFEDIATTYCLVNAAKQIIYIENIGYYYRNREGSITNSIKEIDVLSLVKTVHEFKNMKILKFSKANQTNFIHRHLVGAYFLSDQNSHNLKDEIRQEILQNNYFDLSKENRVQYLLFKFRMYDLYIKSKTIVKQTIKGVTKNDYK